MLSARLSPTAIHHLLATRAVTAVIISSRLRRAAEEALLLFPNGEPTPSIYVQSPYESFLSPNKDAISVEGTLSAPEHYFSESDCNVLILHSSGATGLPKPMHSSHKHFLSFAVCHDLSIDEARGLNLSTLPLFHASTLLDVDV